MAPARGSGDVDGLGQRRDTGDVASGRPARRCEVDAAYEHVPLAMLLVDDRGEVRRVNRAALELAPDATSDDGATRSVGSLLGCARAGEGLGGACGHTASCGACAVWRSVQRGLAGEHGHRRRARLERRAPDGTELVPLVVSSAPSRDPEEHVWLCVEDVADREAAEHRAAIAERYAAIGELAADLAHDFNNVLTALSLQLGLLAEHPALDDDTRAELGELQRMADRTKGVTRKVMSFGRAPVATLEPIDLVSEIESIARLFRRFVGERIDVTVENSPGTPQVRGDAAAIDQLLMNLALNARDAMPHGGRLSFSTKLVKRTCASAPHCRCDERPSGARCGSFVRVQVADTGSGMSEDVARRIFDPFFTTKPSAEGSGLGLKQARDAAEVHGGWIEVESAPGAGTRFDVYFAADVR
ncbi:ATP-binding protein [Myxococcota bacterium]|nr:ATP-binding protein [Myxococcota bacterium]